MSTSLEVWIGAALTLMVLSFLWRDNPFYKFAEHLFVGVSAGYWMVVGWWRLARTNISCKNRDSTGNFSPSSTGPCRRR